MKVLITGITGFVGSHLAEYLLDQGLEVCGTARWRSKTENVDHMLDKVRLVNADIRDGHSMQRVVGDVKPDCIFHLAAQSFVPESWNSPSETLSTNILGLTNVLEAVRQSGMDCTVHVPGSSEEYGLVCPDELPIKETNPLRPMSPYAVSKVAQDLLAQQYHKSFGIKTIITRAFNHTGPRRGEVFVCSSFAKQIAEVEQGKREAIQVGDLNAQRDFTDARDMVRAYWLAVTRCRFGAPYNISSGMTYSMEQVLDTLRKRSSFNVRIEQDPSRMRPSDVPVLQGDCTKFREATGWEPIIPFDKTLEDLLDYWRQKIR